MSLLAVGLANFKQEVLNSDKPVLVDFWGPGCRPCQLVKPVLEQVQATTSNAKVVTLNAQDEPELAEYFQITGFPTVVLFNKGQIGERMVGLRRESDYKALLSSAA